MNERRSFITGIKSVSLSKKEKDFIKKYKPWGIILFSRNIKSIYQTKKLTDAIKKIFKDKNYPILIDQEGGRVNRLRNFFNSILLFILFWISVTIVLFVILIFLKHLKNFLLITFSHLSILSSTLSKPLKQHDKSSPLSVSFFHFFKFSIFL